VSELQILSAPYFRAFGELVQTLQRDPQALLHLEMESYTHFACTYCTECCDQPWTIHVSEDYYHRWYEIFDTHPSGRFKEPMHKVNFQANSQAYAALRQKPGTVECVFLDTDKRCWIHKNYGEAALNDACKAYPRHHKNLGYQYEARYLLHSCEAVPELQMRFPHLLYRFTTLAELNSFALSWSLSNFVGGYKLAGFPGRYETYLLLGLLFDILDLPMPATVLARWRLVIPILEELAQMGIEQVNQGQLELLYQQSLHRTPFFAAPAPQEQAQALAWAQHFLCVHPGCGQWLQALAQGSVQWPQLTAPEQDLLDQHLLSYLRHRLIVLPYPDAFMGQLDWFQHSFLITLQVSTVQWLSLYYRSQEQSLLSSEQAYRAVKVVGQRLEQNRALKRELQVEKMSVEDCLNGMRVLLSLDFTNPHAPPLRPHA